MDLPDRLGPYEIVEQLGRGGMGVVFRARDGRLQRDVAIKLLPLGALGDERDHARFRREALALAKLSQPNIATLFDVGEQNGLSYIVMECVTGRSLATLIEDGPLPIRDVVALGLQIAEALEEAHAHGIVHRDLKPANVMVTPKVHAKVLDFGIAKLLAPTDDAGSGTTLTETRGAVGTLLYMSPEQAMGETVDVRSDIWSLGVVLYEALTGSPPFRAVGTLGVLHAIAQTSPEPLRHHRAAVPRTVERIVMRALSKNPAARYQTAADMSRDLSSVLAALSAGTATDAGGEDRSKLVWLLPSAAALALLSVAGAWTFERSEHRHWAKEVAIPNAATLRLQERPLAAYELLREAERYLPADSQLAALVRSSTRVVSIASSPSGATVEIQDYISGDSGWYPLGTTPLNRATIPAGYFRWRVTPPGSMSVVTAPLTQDTMHFALDSARAAPAGMVYAPGHGWGDFIAFVGWVGPYKLPPFYVDRYEVTNREYQRFVDAGGYERREYWKQQFAEGGHALDWAEAMRRLRDSTARPGPSTWRGGHYPEGHADYPVGGVSWYEAAAYATWTGKTLPTLAQWYYASPAAVASYTVRASNISRDRLAAVGAFGGVGPFGTYDMAGNVKEWIANPLDADRRLILGGAWTSPSYLFSEPEALSAFDRSATNGFRCVRNIEPPPAATLAAITPLERDFSKVTPAPDVVFRAYRILYAYDEGPLNARVEGVVHDEPDWREERVTFNTAYDSERMSAYLFLPKHVRPPFHTVVFFPSARVLDLTNSGTLGDTSFFDYVVQSGRAVLYPVYQGTYERGARGVLPGASQEMTLTVQRFKDLARSLDYLRTRADIDTARLAYLGVSMGAAEGVIYSTLLQDRLKADVLLDGGFFLGRPSPGRDQADFAPRLKIPVLMVNGRYDFSFSLERAQIPLFRMLGSAPADKRHVVLDTPHDVRARRPEMTREVLAWLDKYLGPVGSR
jgi:serine/threonine protein kinase/dienelactone hydrolase